MPPRPATSYTLVRAATALPALILGAGPKHERKRYPEWGSAEFYWHIGISVILILLGGAFSGLTLGLMGLDELHLRVLRVSSDDPQERKNAAVVLKLLAKGRHWVLVVSVLENPPSQYLGDLISYDRDMHTGLTSRQCCQSNKCALCVLSTNLSYPNSDCQRELAYISR